MDDCSWRSRFSYANVMATVAVFIALGGSSYAAIKLPPNSVGHQELKRSAVTPPKLSRATLALVGRSRRAARTAATSDVVYRDFESTVPAAQAAGGSVSCPRRRPHAISGFFGSDDAGVEDGGKLVLTSSHPYGRRSRGWSLTIKNLDSQPHTWFGGVVCVR